MSEKTLHHFIIFVLLVTVVLLSMIACKSEPFAGGSVPPSDKAGNLSARLRSIQNTGALAGRLRGGNATVSSLPARLRGGSPITGASAGAGGLMARIELPTLEHFRGVGRGESLLSAKLRSASNDAMGSAAATVSDKTGHDNKAISMSIIPPASKMTIMSNLTTK